MAKRLVDIGTQSTLESISKRLKDEGGIFCVPMDKVMRDGGVFSVGAIRNGEQGTASFIFNGSFFVIPNNSDYAYKMTDDNTCWVKSIRLPHTINVHESSVLVFNNPVEEKTEVHILGGIGKYSKTHYRFDGDEWSIASELPYAFCSGKAVSNGNEIHILGGINTSLKDHYKWDGGTWEQSKELPYDVTGSTLIAFGKSIHLIGGVDSYTRNHYKFIEDWEELELPSTIDGISFASAAIYGGCIHILGGLNSTNHYTFNGTVWETGEPIPEDGNNTSSQSASSGIIGESNSKKLWITGRRAYYLDTNGSWVGYQEFTRNISHGSMCKLGNDIVLLSGNKMYSVSDMNDIKNISGTVVSDSAIVKDGGKIHILGSSTTGFEKRHVVYNNGEWEEQKSLPVIMRNISAVLLNEEIHLIGECDSYYNHYKITKNGEYENVSPAPFSTLHGQKLVSLGKCIYSVSLVNNNESLRLLLYKFNGNQWSLEDETNIGKYYNYYDYMSNCSVVVFQNRIHILVYIPNQQSLKHLVWSGSEFIFYGSTTLYNWECIQSVVSDNYIHVFGYNGNVTEHLLTQYNVSQQPSIEVFLEKNHTFLCDKTAFLPNVGIVEEVDYGYRATDSGVYRFLMVRKSPYSIS